MPTETDKPKTDCTHRKIVKNNKIEKKKKLEGENDTIDRILRSPAYTEADKKRHVQQKERNLKEIIKLSDEINKIDNDLLSPSGNHPIKRGRSQTRGANRRHASPSPIQIYSRSASSSVPRRRSDQTDEDKLRKIQDQLQQSRTENEVLRRGLYAESSRYGEEIFTDTDSKVSYRLRVQNADLSIQHRNLSIENKHLRDVNYKLRLDSEIFSSGIKQLETEKETLATMLQDQNTEITRYKLAIVELEHDIDLIRDEKERFTIEKKSLNGQIKELSHSLSEERHKVREMATKLQENYEGEILDLEQQITSLTEELTEKETALTKLVKVDIPHLQRERDEYKESAAENKHKLYQDMKLQLEEIQKRSCQQVSEYEEMLHECEIENENLRKENSETMEQLKTLRYFFIKRRDYYSRIAQEAEDNNVILREGMKIEIEEKARVQKENNTLKSQLDSAIKENEWNCKNNLEELGNLKMENDKLKENLELMQEAYQRERCCVTALQQKETEMRQNIREIIKRNKNLENEVEKEKASISTKREHEKEIHRLYSVVREKDLEEDKLRIKIEDLEKKNNEIQSRTDKRLRDIEENERERKQLKEEIDKELNRLRQLEINYKCEAGALRSNKTDLENKVQHLQAEKERLQRNGEKERKAAEELRHALSSEKRNSDKLRDRIKDLERSKEQEIYNKSEAEVLKSNRTDLEKKIQYLQAETKRLQRNGEMEREKADELQFEVNSEKGKLDELRDRIKDLERLLRIEEKGREQLKQNSDKELNRLRQLEINNKIEKESLKSNHTDLEKKVKQLQDEKEILLQNEKSERKIADRLKSELDAEKRDSNKLRDKMRDLERESLLSIEKIETGRKQALDEMDRKLIWLRRSENDYKNKADALKRELTDLRRDFVLIQQEKDELIESGKAELKKAKDIQKELNNARREEVKYRDRIKELERQMMTVPKVDPSMSAENSRLKEDLKHLGIELKNAQQSLLSIEKIETGRKQVLDEMDRKMIRLRRSENDYKNKADTLKSELTDLRRDFALLQQEKDELIESGKAEMKKEKDVQKELNDARIEEVKFRDRIKELERQMMTVPKVDPSMSAENSRLKEDLKHLGIELKKAQQRLTQLEINNKIEAASHTSNQTALEKKVKQLQDEKEKLLQNEEMKRKLAEKIKSESGDRDLERERLRRLENVYKNETDTLKHELADLKKNIELLQEEKEELAESEETERKIAETLQNELDDAKREKLMLQDRIKELQRQMNRFPKVDPSMPEENSRLKEDLKHLGTELQKAQQKITGNEESVRHYMRQVETLQREKQQAIAEKESALTRLSALAGDRLRDNNAAIADLSDENRPINLGEKFSELYDNQWTDAIEKLEKLMTERDAIQKLLSMIQEIYCACKDIAKEQLDLISKAFGLEGRKEKLKRLKDFRKSMASDNLQDIKERVNSSCVSKDFSQEAAYCASYINRSVELCWYMCIQDPPVVLEFKASHGDVFNDKIYRHFTKSGRTIDYMVWPVMYLHSNGPLLQKGVVQPV